MLGVHVQPQVDRGIVSTGAGAVNAAYDSFEIVVHGRPGHGAYPHVAVDPIATLATIIGELSSLPQRLVSPTNPTVVSVGQITGGTAHKVIASEASCRGSIRTYSEPDRTRLHEAITRMATAVAESRGLRPPPASYAAAPPWSTTPASCDAWIRSCGRWASPWRRTRSAPAGRTTSPSTDMPPPP